MSLTVGRIVLGPPLQWQEAIGDPVTTLGGAVVPAPRQAPRHQVSIGTYAADGASDTVADRLILRKRLRAMLNNEDLKLQGFVYIIYSDDPELSGWYLPDFGQLADIEGSAGLASGFWKLENVNWLQAGHLRTHREAKNIWMRDLRTGGPWRDQLKLIYSTDFSWLPALQLSVLPNGAATPNLTVSGLVVPLQALPTCRDGGICQQAAGLNDLVTVAYDRPESAMNLSDVYVYDRTGAGDAPNTGPGATWVDAEGPDYPWNWLTAGQPNDCPVLDNGLCRVRYDATNNTPGFKVDVWNGAAYVEQGKMIVTRNATSPLGAPVCDTFISASMQEYTPERAVILVVLAASGDSASREKVYITMQRGEFGVVFEVYPAIQANSVQADAILTWTPALNGGVTDLNESAMKIDSKGSANWVPGAAGTAANSATAGTGSGTGKSGPFPTVTTIGAANFTNSENWVALLRCPTTYNVVGSYQHNLIVVQAAGAEAQTARGNSAYGVLTDEVVILGQSGQGYLQAGLYFGPTSTDQVMEAESMTPSAGTTSGGDPSASGAATTQTSSVTISRPHVTRGAWCSGLLGTYRVWVRAKTTATQASLRATTPTTTGVAVTLAGSATPTYTWIDLGEIVADGGTFTLQAWVSNGAGIVEVDRIESFLVQDRTRTTAVYSGARDYGQASLMDSRALGAVVAR